MDAKTHINVISPVTTKPNNSDIDAELAEVVEVAKSVLLRDICVGSLLESVRSPSGGSESRVQNAIRRVALTKPEALLAFATKLLPPELQDEAVSFSPVVIQVVSSEPNTDVCLEGVVIQSPPSESELLTDDGL